MALSPDEKNLAKTIRRNSGSDLWLQDMNRAVLSRSTFRSGYNRSPVWSPDASRLIFASQAAGSFFDIYRKPAGGNGQEELLLHGGVNAYPDDLSSDGK